MELVFSMEGGYIHIHCLLEATPGTTAFKCLRTYWHKRHGRVFLDKRELQNPGEGYAIYCNRQAIKTIVLTCNWPQTSPQNQTPNLTVNVSNTVHSVGCMIINSVHSVNCMVSNSVTGINSNYSSYTPLLPEYPAPVYDADNCCPCEEPPSLDSIPADVVAEIVAGEEMYSGQEFVVVDKLVDCKENMPGSNDHDACKNVDDNVKIDSSPTGTPDACGKSQKGGCFHARYNPAVSGNVVVMPGLLGGMAAFQNVVPSTTIRAGPRASPATATTAA